MQTPRAVATSYWRAEERRDTEAVLAHFHPAATFAYPLGELVGLDAIRPFYEGMGDRFPGLSVEVLDDVTVGDSAAIAWRSRLTQTDGRYAMVDGVNLVDVADGRFTRIRCFYDTAQLEQLHDPDGEEPGA